MKLCFGVFGIIGKIYGGCVRVNEKFIVIIESCWRIELNLWSVVSVVKWSFGVE